MNKNSQSLDAKNRLVELQQRRLEMINQIDGSVERLSIDLRSSGLDADIVEALANKHREDLQKFLIGPIDRQIQTMEKMQRNFTIPIAKVL